MTSSSIPIDFSPDMLLQYLSTGVIFVSQDKVVTFLNARAEELLHLSASEAVGKRLDLLPLRAPLYRVLSEDCRDPFEMSIEGRILWVSTFAVATEGMTGELTEIRDITAERKEKRQREEAVAMMTHDLKSPLTVLMGYMQIVKDELYECLDTRLLASVKEMERSSRILLSMIEDVLDSYRLELGLLSIAKEWCNLRDIVESCCHDIDHEASAQGVSISFSAGGEFRPVEGDPRQLSRIFANILGNAVKFTPTGGKVEVTIAGGDKELLVNVADTGIGIAEMDLARIFTKYYRTERAAGYKGTGLGLAICKAIVEAHGGRIEVRSIQGSGSTFTIALPCPPGALHG